MIINSSVRRKGRLQRLRHLFTITLIKINLRQQGEYLGLKIGMEKYLRYSQCMQR